MAAASPALELDAGIAGTERTLRVIGIDAVRQGRIELLKPDRVILSPAAAELVKERLELVVGGNTVTLEVGGDGRQSEGHGGADRRRHRAMAPRTAWASSTASTSS